MTREEVISLNKNKCIDAECLCAMIEKRINNIESCPFIEADFGAEKKREGKIQAYNDVLTLIASLQQEQPKEICHKCIHHGKDDDYCYNPHSGMQRLINENGVYECTGFYEKEEQPEVDLEEEIDLWISENENIHHRDKLMVWLLKDVAHHFYELGLKARKK